MAEFGDVAPLEVEAAQFEKVLLKVQPNDANPSTEALLEKYKQERAKRLRDDGPAQYIDPAQHEKLKRYQEDIWVTPETPNPGLDNLKPGASFKVVLFGAGFSSLTFAARLIEAGIKDIALIDIAGGFGGTWYWNRYPGLMCDVESYIYMPLLEEMDYVPKNKYAYGYELREYAEKIADKYALLDKAIFRVKIDQMRWDESANQWIIKLDRVDGKDSGNLEIRGEVVITNTGQINIPKMPDLPGMIDFAGHSFHTSRWDYSYTGGSPTQPDLTNLQDKRVGIIGTGATAIQAVPELAKWAKELYVFQRTPSSVDVRDNRVTDVDWFNKEVRGSGKGWQRRRAENFNAHVSNVQSDVDLVGDGWTHMRTFSCVVGSPFRDSNIESFVGGARALDFERQERIRKRVDTLVTDKKTAEKLKPWYFGWCKRPCFHDQYLQSFNRPNVTLVGTDGKGIDRITETGAVVADKEYPVDVIIFGTGYYIKGGDSPAGKGGFKAFGRGGVSLDDKWADHITTLHGLLTDDFPNFFFTGPSQAGAAANQAYTMDTLSEHITYILSEASKKSKDGQIYIEPQREAMEKWIEQIMARAGAFAAMPGCTPGYFNAEGAADKEKPPEELAKAMRGVMWGDGVNSYIDVLKKWRDEGTLSGLRLTPPVAAA